MALAQLPPGVNPWEVPAGMPPPGVEPNLTNPESTGWIAIPIATVFLVIMYIVLGLKIYVRKALTTAGFEVEDYLSLLSGVGVTFQYICVVLSVTVARYGTHIWDLPLAFIISDTFLKITYTQAFTQIISLIVKLTFLVLYLRLFKPFRWMCWLCWAGFGFTAAFYSVAFIVQMYSVTPAPGQAWAEAILSPRYTIQLRLNPVVGIVGLIIDVYIFMLPILGASRLQLSRQRAYAVMGTFAFGLLAVAASAATLAYRYKLNADQADFTYQVWVVVLTIFIELCAGTTSAALPGLLIIAHHPKTKAIWSKLTSGLHGSQGTSASRPQKQSNMDNGRSGGATWEQANTGRSYVKIAGGKDDVSSIELGSRGQSAVSYA